MPQDPLSAIILVSLGLALARFMLRGLTRGLLRGLFGGGRRKLAAPFEIPDAFVIDGDTLSAGDLRIRLFGIDAPESNHPHGGYATEALRNQIASQPGVPLRVEPRERDRYARIVARVVHGKIDLGATMVAAGYARAAAKYSRAYVGLEKQARRNKAGLWSLGRIADPAQWRRATAR